MTKKIAHFSQGILDFAIQFFTNQHHGQHSEEVCNLSDSPFLPRYLDKEKNYDNVFFVSLEIMELTKFWRFWNRSRFMTDKIINKYQD